MPGTRENAESDLCDGEETSLAIDTIIYVGTKSGLLIFHMDETDRPEPKSRMTMRKLEEMLEVLN